MAIKMRRANQKQVNALDRYRRGQKVLLKNLAARQGCGLGWLSEALQGKVPLMDVEVRVLRGHITELAREQQGAAK